MRTRRFALQQTRRCACIWSLPWCPFVQSPGRPRRTVRSRMVSKVCQQLRSASSISALLLLSSDATLEDPRKTNASSLTGPCINFSRSTCLGTFRRPRQRTRSQVTRSPLLSILTRPRGRCTEPRRLATPCRRSRMQYLLLLPCTRKHTCVPTPPICRHSSVWLLFGAFPQQPRSRTKPRNAAQGGVPPMIQQAPIVVERIVVRVPSPPCGGGAPLAILRLDRPLLSPGPRSPSGQPCLCRKSLLNRLGTASQLLPGSHFPWFCYCP